MSLPRTPIRNLSSLLLLLSVLAAPASFAQQAGATGPVTDSRLVPSEPEADCSRPISPAIPEQDISRRLERQLDREMREFFDAAGTYLACVRAAYWLGEADNAPESELLGRVEEHNAAVKEVDELAALYEERIGPISKVLPRRRVASANARHGIGAMPGPTWAGTDTGRFPSYVEPPPGMIIP
jgi:hypothetical protein